MVPEYEKLTASKLTGGEWPCPIHILALEGKNPTVALCKPPKDDDPNAFNHENALNIADKWWYICDKHFNLIQHWWKALGIKATLNKPIRGLAPASARFMPLEGFGGLGRVDKVYFS